MNSLLQALFHVKQFRRAVYHMPTQEGEEADGSIPLAMKHLFFRLQYSPTPVSTKELVRSFGWTSMEAFVQQDVEELELKLCEKLEEKMKGMHLYTRACCTPALCEALQNTRHNRPSFPQWLEQDVDLRMWN